MDIKERIAQLESLIMDLAPAIDDHLNPNKQAEGRKIGFLLCAFDFGDKGAMSYATTAQPADLVDAVIELCENLGATARLVKPTKRGQG